VNPLPPSEVGRLHPGEAGLLGTRTRRVDGEQRPAAARFYAGAPEPSWLRGWNFYTPAYGELGLFVSHGRLSRIASVQHWFWEVESLRMDGLPALPWALDSGAFTEIDRHHRWRTSAREYAAAVDDYDEHVSGLEWAAPQDWMCEPSILAKTGATVGEHQRRTVQNFVQLRREWDGLSDRACPFMPVVQGWTVADYLRCVEMYGDAGVDLRAYRVVGVGSVCRRQATGAIRDVFSALADDCGLWLHGFGVKTEGLHLYADRLVSADSMAWSKDALHSPPIAGHTHQHCTSCPFYAARWWLDIRGRIDQVAARGTEQLSLFGAVA
jgi:hypothetical protein